MNQEYIGEFLCDLRKDHGLTQAQLASKFYISREAVSKWERGINLPDYSTMIGLSKLYGLTINEILACEMINDDNRDRISAIALNILNDSKRRIRKNKMIATAIIFLIILFVFVFYFIYNYNSLKVYTSYGDNGDYYLTQGLIVTSKQKSFIQLGSIYNSLSYEAVDKEDISDIKLYYENKDNYHVLLETDNINNLYLDPIEYNKFIKTKSIKEVLGNMHVSFVIDNKKQVINLENTLSFSNKYILPLLFKKDKVNDKTTTSKTNDNVPDIISKNFTYTDGKYIAELTIDKDNFSCEYNGDNIYCLSESIIATYYIKSKEIKFIINGEDVLYSYNKNKCITNNCNKYNNLITDFENKILK